MTTATKTAPMTKPAKPTYPHTLTLPTDRTIRVERTFNAKKERVWKAVTDPKLLAQWWDRGNKLTVERYEFVKGGHWRFVEHSDHGDHGFEGRYREITPTDRISLTFEWDGMPGHTVVQTLELTDLGDGRTKMVSESLFFTSQE